MTGSLFEGERESYGGFFAVFFAFADFVSPLERRARMHSARATDAFVHRDVRRIHSRSAALFARLRLEKKKR